MGESARFIGLPEEFAPPERAADQLAGMNSIEQREAYFVRIPKGWQPTIATLAIHAMAARISAMATKVERQYGLAAVPHMWREEVKALTISFFTTRDLRAEHRAEVAARRAREAVSA